MEEEPNIAKERRPQEAPGLTENQASPEQTHFTHPLSTHLIEHLLHVRPWGNRDEKDTVLVLVFNVVRMSNG